MSTEEVLAVIERDRAFFRRSGGGVTLGGGEPTRQAAFAHDLLRACRERNIHTAVETCGHCGWEVLEQMIPLTGLFLYDLKHADREKHRRLTGVDNGTIIENLRRLCAASAPLKIRYPLIPGVNAARADIAGLIMLLKSLPAPVAVEISPYHRFGEGKYAMLGREYTLKGLKTPTPDQAAAVVAQITSSGIDCLALH
jgi:pyruvate formate lyase activating enzyme